MKKTVYLDTTIPSYLFDDRDTIRNYIDVTRQWWEQERQHFEVWISEETQSELNCGNYPRKSLILDAVSQLPVLPPHRRIAEIVQAYLDHYLMPKVAEGDALHLAYASFYKIDFLLTWNCKHLANANKYQHIRIINTRLQLHTPEIVTPLALFITETDL
jgi:predicted nucleic acid-binding protein